MAAVLLETEEIGIMRLQNLVKRAAQEATETYVLEILGILSFVSMQILRLGSLSIRIFFFLFVVFVDLRELILCHVHSKQNG